MGPGAGATDPAPVCPAAIQIDPAQLYFASYGITEHTTSVTATHTATLVIDVSNSESPFIPDQMISVTGPAGLKLTPDHGDAHTSYLRVDFTPTAPGPVTLTATWTQPNGPLHDDRPDGPRCTASASATVVVTKPLPSRAPPTLGYSIAHRPGHPGDFNEFVLKAVVTSDTYRGDRSPISVVARAVASARRPLASTHPITLTFDPLNQTPGRAQGDWASAGTCL